MSWPNLWFLPRAFRSHGGHGGGELPAFPAPSTVGGLLVEHHPDTACRGKVEICPDARDL
jgi:hypothetical protein